MHYIMVNLQPAKQVRMYRYLSYFVVFCMGQGKNAYFQIHIFHLYQPCLGHSETAAIQRSKEYRQN